MGGVKIIFFQCNLSYSHYFGIKPKLSDFLLDLRRSLALKGFAKILMHQDPSTYLRKKSLNLVKETDQR